MIIPNSRAFGLNLSHTTNTRSLFVDTMLCQFSGILSVYPPTSTRIILWKYQSDMIMIPIARHRDILTLFEIHVTVHFV